ncbi:MAG: helix-turn-helix transcriptional regulator [Lentisphaerae bacterium]|nr:helix-turn-helix transcriptional regulator [Lentisphaerota bacterium]MCP4088163.1 helix-turn-helix transcriptional regulator [Actinomycetes bacterium]
MYFKEVLKKLMSHCRITTLMLAEALDLSQPYVSKIRSGDGGMSPKQFRKTFDLFKSKGADEKLLNMFQGAYISLRTGIPLEYLEYKYFNKELSADEMLFIKYFRKLNNESKAQLTEMIITNHPYSFVKYVG